jgi:hypothetical protein
MQTLSRRGNGRKSGAFAVCTLTLMLLVSASSFTLKELSSLPIASRSSVSNNFYRNGRESRLHVATAPDVVTMPEVGKNGVYSIVNEAQHK